MAHTSAAHEAYITGLKNAHAMEKQALAIMRPQLERIEHYPEMARMLDQHIRETEVQIERLNRLLDGVDAGSSGLKDTMMSMFGGMASLGHATAGDEILKNSIANHAFENYEIAAYTILRSIAEAAGQTQAIPLIEQNLEEERRMAAWIAENLPTVTREYLSLRGSGERAST